MKSGESVGMCRPAAEPAQESAAQERDVKTVCLLYGCQCNACCERIDRALRKVKGVRSVEVNLYKATATVEHDESCSCDHLIGAIERIGYLAQLQTTNHTGPSQDMNRRREHQS